VKELARFEAADSGSVLVEVDESDPGFDRVARSAGEFAIDTGKHLATALEVIRPTVDAVVENLRQLARRPDTAELQLGIRLNAQVGAVIASTQAEGHLQLTLTWTNPDSPTLSAA